MTDAKTPRALIVDDDRPFRESLDLLVEREGFATRAAGSLAEPPHVEIGGHASESEITYYVRDHGIGFDMRYSDRLFRLFERLHPGGTHEGHGVGLAIVARLVRRHGGRVWAQGAVDKGATFHLSLPAQRGDEEALGEIA